MCWALLTAITLPFAVYGDQPTESSARLKQLEVLGTRRYSHPGGIRCMAFAHERRLLATGGGVGDGLIRLWDVSAGKALGVLQDPNQKRQRQGVVALFFFDSDKRLAAVYHLGVTVFDVEQKKALRSTKGSRYLESAAMAPDNKTLWVGDQDGDLSQFAVADLSAVLKPIRTGSAVRCIAPAPDGATVVAGLHSGLAVFDARNGKKTAAMEGPQFFADQLFFLNNGKTLMGLFQSTTQAEHWETLSFSQLPLIGNMPARGAYTTAVSADGKRFAWGTYDGVVQVVDVPSDKTIREWKLGVGPVEHLMFSPDGNTLAVVCAGEAVRLLDVKTGERLNAREGHDGTIGLVSWRADKKTILSASGARDLIWWDGARGVVPPAAGANPETSGLLA